MRAPKFWNDKTAFLGKLLNPLGYIYGWTVARRFRRVKPYQADIPVICVGNLTAGGTGKTPICLALGKMLSEIGQPFFYLNHGYKSKQSGVMVTDQSTAIDVGDEALLLSETAPTVVDHHRARGAQIAIRKGAKAIIMDDGFQNPGLIKTLSFIVVDGKTGFGNNRMIPAGPLREPVSCGLQRADAVIIVGEDTYGVRDLIQKINPDMPVLTGHFQPNAEQINLYRGQKAIAFAGIGRPEKFFGMLTDNGIHLTNVISFPDHYTYTGFDIDQILTEAGAYPILTTTKDFVKIPKEKRNNIHVISGDFIFDNPDEILTLLQGAINP